jgi:hypothetical protein
MQVLNFLCATVDPYFQAKVYPQVFLVLNFSSSKKERALHGRKYCTFLFILSLK